jgi:hypothetical protein
VDGSGLLSVDTRKNGKYLECWKRKVNRLREAEVHRQENDEKKCWKSVGRTLQTLHTFHATEEAGSSFSLSTFFRVANRHRKMALHLYNTESEGTNHRKSARICGFKNPKLQSLPTPAVING